MKTLPGSTNSTPFKKLGSLVYKRRKYIIIAWIVALVAVLPIVVNVGKSTSLQLGSTAGASSNRSKPMT